VDVNRDTSFFERFVATDDHSDLSIDKFKAGLQVWVHIVETPHLDAVGRAADP
jgi:hypothetical protein